MNREVYGKLRVKTLKFRAEDNVGKRLNDLREYMGKKGNHMTVKNPYALGKGTGDVLIETALSMCKDLGVREIKLQTGVGTNTRVYGDHNTIGKKLKNIREDKDMTLNDVKSINPTMVRNIENKTNSSGMRYYMKYARSLGINELKIFV